MNVKSSQREFMRLFGDSYESGCGAFGLNLPSNNSRSFLQDNHWRKVVKQKNGGQF
jgi:hypothetical protein